MLTVKNCTDVHICLQSSLTLVMYGSIACAVLFSRAFAKS